ncbi:YqaJ viral recombinase family protein [Caballeronia sp. LZ001]|uniref:lambda exonuclease family protein n=1 Tax=Caballeronia sp. LZ001 TaxID=3038553 RepID=UPI00285F1AF7|nr:YqaJ viral recombinase family protein [Caballeronia sp. LZ001]MDR5802167.1 YqaJ viral recombinase family protein [Caballeronia sp. LZ001]
MILIECMQGTEEWHKARCGVITASKFRGAVDVTKKGERTAKSTLYAAQVALERISGVANDETFVTWQMKRGTELEPAARMEYEALTGNFATESGVVLTDDRLFGYSTDGFIGDDGLIEIKSLASAEKIVAMWRDGDMSDYMHQIQGGLWITGRKWADFVMYCPQLESIGKQIFHRRVERDEAFIEQLEKDLVSFAKLVDENESVLREAVPA